MPSVQQRIDKYMRDKLGFRTPTRAAVIYYGAQFWEQVLAVVPITMCLVVAMAIYFQQTVENPSTLAGGLLAAMVGLVLFVDGLRVAIMPLGSMLGQQLPEQFKVRYILVVACAIGILCTYAEPAIASLRPLAALVKRCQTPYLYFVLNDMSEVLVLSIGLGVGVAAIVGVLRFLRGWSLKPLVALSLLPTIACAMYMKWGNEELAPLIGLAWDCGAVTTGPVTVPILLSLGIGVIKGQKARHAARELVDQAAQQNKGQALEGFGIITLASMFPILAVSLMSICISIIYTPEEIRTDFGRIDCATYVEDTSTEEVSDSQMILDAFTFAVRSILPLNFFLVLMIKVVLRRDLPKTSFEVPVPMGLLEDLDESGTEVKDPEAGRDSEDEDEEDRTKDHQRNVMKKIEERAKIKESKQEERAKKRERILKGFEVVDNEQEDKVLRREATDKTRKRRRSVELSSRGDQNHSADEAPAGPCAQWPLVAGVFESMLGMTLFNIGLTYGFTSLGDQSGLLLPAAFIETKTSEGSPFYAYSAGVAIVLSTIFSLGFLATRAEPALRVMGKTVETLSEGQFSQTALVYTVCVGVGCGMVAGSSKILFGVNIIYLILIKYAVATFFTVFSSENFTNIAWDSAGVTTGPVTVPFVLSVGIGFSKAKNAEEGFGILTCASVAPIITVLFTDLLRRMVQSAVQAHNQRRLRRLISTTSQTDSVEDLQLLLGPDSQARSERLRENHESADAATQCDLADIESSAAYDSALEPKKLQLAASGDTSTGTTYSAGSPVTRARSTEGTHVRAVTQAVSTALNGSLSLHQMPASLQITPVRQGLTPGAGNLIVSPRHHQSVRTTITVTTDYLSPEEIDVATGPNYEA